MHKLSAGDGYTYLTRHIAGGDVDRVAGQDAADYYTAEGNPPGRWLGAGLDGLGLAAGQEVTEQQMRALFGLGLHPDADRIIAAYQHAHLQAGMSEADVQRVIREARAAAQLGTAFGRYESLPPFAERVAERLATLRSETGREPTRAEVATVKREESRRPRHAVAGYDLVFTPVKSASVLWALHPHPGVRAAVRAAHQDAVASALAMLETHAAFTRAGRDGIAQVDTHGLVGVAFDHYDSRAGDPNLHTHVVISNKIQRRGDGRWRALDGRPLHAITVAASEHYNTAFQTNLTHALGVAFTPRWTTRSAERGQPVWEIEGVPQPWIEHYSKRHAAIEDRYNQLVSDYRHRHGHDPTARVAYQLARQATLETRQGKKAPRSLEAMRRHWSDDLTHAFGTHALDQLANAINDLPSRGREPDPQADPQADPQPVRLISSRRVDRPDDTDGTHGAGRARRELGPVGAGLWAQDPVEQLAGAVVENVAQMRSTWTVWNLHAEAERMLRDPAMVRLLDLRLEVRGGHVVPSAEHVAQVIERIVAAAVSPGFSISVEAPELLSEPAALRRADGHSVFTEHGAARFTSAAVLAAEERLLAAARALPDSDGRSVDPQETAPQQTERGARTATWGRIISGRLTETFTSRSTQDPAGPAGPADHADLAGFSGRGPALPSPPSPDAVRTALARFEDETGTVLDPGQRDLVTTFATDPRLLVAGIGAADTGKTTAMRAYLHTLSTTPGAATGPTTGPGSGPGTGPIRSGTGPGDGSIGSGTGSGIGSGAGGGRLVALATSSSSAAVLGAELGVAAENLHKFLYEHTSGRYADRLAAAMTEADARRSLPAVAWPFALGPGDVVLLDEAGMAGTFNLDRLVQIAAGHGARVRLLGDYRQLSAVESGGALRLIATEVGAVELDTVHRFHDPDEAAATLRLQVGDTTGLDFYTRHGRVHGGSKSAMLEAAYRGWWADVQAGQTSFLPAATNADVTALSARARADRVAAGQVEPDGVELHDGNHAGVGDWIVTRRVNRRLTLNGGRDFVRNGDPWHVRARHHDGSLTIEHLHHHGRVRLPAGYVTSHVELLYATTAHRVQGGTVDTAHPLITDTTTGGTLTREHLYVMTTRARQRTTLYVATHDVLPLDEDDRLNRARRDPDHRAALEVLHTILTTEAAERSATETIRAAKDAAAHLSRLIPRYLHALPVLHPDAPHGRTRDEHDITTAAPAAPAAPAATASRHAHAGLLGPALGSRLATRVIHESTWRALQTALTHARATGHDPAELLRDAVRETGRRNLDTHRHISQTLAHHIHRHLTTAQGATELERVTAQGSPPPHLPPWVPPPPTDEPHPYIQTAARYIDARTTTLALNALHERPAWSHALGTVPHDADRRRRWLRHAATLAAYREEFEITDNDPAHPLGPYPDDTHPGDLHHDAYWHAAAAIIYARALALAPLDPDPTAAFNPRTHTSLDPGTTLDIDIDVEHRIAVDTYLALPDSERHAITTRMVGQLGNLWFGPALTVASNQPGPPNLGSPYPVPDVDHAVTHHAYRTHLNAALARRGHLTAHDIDSHALPPAGGRLQPAPSGPRPHATPTPPPVQPPPPPPTPRIQGPTLGL